MSMTRRQRWTRAEKLKLEPPHDVMLMLNAFPENEAKGIWHGRVSEDLPWTG
jgi:hypothetical protein